MYLLGALLLGFLCGMVFTPVILAYCKRHKLYDIPNERKMHTKAVPRMGGLSFFPGMMLAFGACLLIITLNEQSPKSLNIGSASYLLGLAFIYAVGIVDDFIGLNAPIKFVAQTLAACLLPLTGLYLNNLYGLAGIYELPAYVGMPLTIFVVVFIVNAINLIDGIDGLAASLSILALGGFLGYFYQYGVFRRTYSIMIAAVIGSLLAFLYFNMWGKPKNNTKLFMGDGGSLFLGYMLGFLTVKSAMDSYPLWPYRQEAVLVPLALLFVPTADVIRVTLYRVFHHMPVFTADKNHIHHKLMSVGMSQHQALLTILLLAVTVTVFDVLAFGSLNVNVIVLIDIVVYSLGNLLINILAKNAKES